MDREELEGYLAQGMSLAEIGQFVGQGRVDGQLLGRKFGLSAVQQSAAPKGGMPARGDLRRPILRREGCQHARRWRSELGVEPGDSAPLDEEVRAHEPSQPAARRDCDARAGEGPLTRAHLRATRADVLSSDEAAATAATAARARRSSRTAPARQADPRLRRPAGDAACAGTTRYVGALQFHHLDRSTKAFTLSHSGVTRSIARHE